MAVEAISATFKGRLACLDKDIELKVPIVTTGTINEAARAVIKKLHLAVGKEANDWCFEKKEDNNRLIYFDEILKNMFAECKSSGKDKILVDKLNFYQIHERLSIMTIGCVVENEAQPLESLTRVFDVSKFASYLRTRNDLNKETKLTDEMFISLAKRFLLGCGLGCPGFDGIANMMASREKCTLLIEFDDKAFLVNEIGYWFDTSSNDFTIDKYASMIEGCQRLIENQLFRENAFDSMNDGGKMSGLQVFEALKQGMRQEWQECGLSGEAQIICEKLIGNCLSGEIDRAVTQHLHKSSKSSNMESKESKESNESNEESKEKESFENSNFAFLFNQDLAILKQRLNNYIVHNQAFYDRLKGACRILNEKFGALPITKKKCDIDCINGMNVEMFVKYGWQKRNVMLFLKAIDSSIEFGDIDRAYGNCKIKFCKWSKDEMKQVIGDFELVPAKTASILISNVMRVHFGGQRYQDGLRMVSQSHNLGLSGDGIDDLSKIIERIEPHREEMVLSLMNGDISLTFIEKFELQIYHLLFDLIIKEANSADSGDSILTEQLNKLSLMKLLDEAVACGEHLDIEMYASELREMVTQRESEFEKMSVNDQNFWLGFGLLYFEQEKNEDEASKFVARTLKRLTDAMLTDVNGVSGQDELVSAVVAWTHKMKKDNEARCNSLVAMVGQSVQDICDANRQLSILEKLLECRKADLIILLPLIYDTLVTNENAHVPSYRRALIAMNWNEKVRYLTKLPQNCRQFSYVSGLAWIKR